LPRTLGLAGAAFALACRSSQPAPSVESLVTVPSSASAPAPASDPIEVRLVTSTNQARRLELVRRDGELVARFYPGFFNQTLLVPDVEGNSGRLVSRKVAGSDVLAASLERESGRVLVAVRGFIYAETSTDLVFVIAAKQAKDPPDPSTVQPLFYDGPDVLAEAAEGRERGRRAVHDVTEVGFAEDGRLLLTLADASGGVCHLEYDAALRPLACRWEGGESRKCPEGLHAR
jgi:hypothetical protein